MPRDGSDDAYEEIAKENKARNSKRTVVAAIKDVRDLESDAERTARNIREIGSALGTLRKHFKDKLIVLLLNDMTNVSKTDIKRVLEALPELASTYLAPKKETKRAKGR